MSAHIKILETIRVLLKKKKQANKKKQNFISSIEKLSFRGYVSDMVSKTLYEMSNWKPADTAKWETENLLI